jgi:predicted TIM-barrel fold metal-dependent hydrolase
MKIIDSQVHIWLPPAPDRPWNPGAEPRPPFSYEDILACMLPEGVQGAILVPPSFEGHRNDYAIEAATKYPNRFAIMGRLSLQDAASPRQLETWKSQPGMLGVRLTFHRDKDRPWLSDGTADWFWPLAERYDIPVMVHAPERLAKLGEIAARHPGLRIIVDHMGFARATMDEANVYVKVSALPCYSTQPYPYRNLHLPLRRIIDAFGPQRCFWGTDFTRMPKTSSYKEAVTMFTEELAFLSPPDLEWIMGRGLVECLRWRAAGN